MTNKSHKYQLVLEFHGDDLENYDRVVTLETKLEAKLVSGGVDGHDAGGGIVNIFIYTSEPKGCFEEAIRIIEEAETKPIAAGYRHVEEEEYVRLLPADDLTPFELK